MKIYELKFKIVYRQNQEAPTLEAAKLIGQSMQAEVFKQNPNFDLVELIEVKEKYV